MIKEQRVKIDEVERVKTFNGLVNDSNRRVDKYYANLNKCQDNNNNNNSKSKSKENNKNNENDSSCFSDEKRQHAKKCYTKEEWLEIYNKRFLDFENKKQSKLLLGQINKDEKKKEIEDKILEAKKQIKGNSKYIQIVVNRLWDDTDRRKLGINKKCKYDKSEHLNQTQRNNNTESDISNFQSKKSNKYFFNVNF
jgi:hypothetical protein